MTWSAENATKAYLRSLKMGQKGKSEQAPDVAEFISALAAGNNAQLMVEVCSAAGPTTLALVAAAQQTGGKVVCIVPRKEDLGASRHVLREHVRHVEVVAGRRLGEYEGADFALVDCHVEGDVIGEVVGGGGRRVVVGYNAGGCKVGWGGVKGQFLPIGEGLLVARVGGGWRRWGGRGVGSRWVVKVDECTGEEHVFRVNSPAARSSKVVGLV